MLKHKLLLASAAWVVLGAVYGTAQAGETILKGPVPDWVRPVEPHLSNTPNDAAAPLRIERLETQVRFFGTHSATFQTTAVRPLSPMGLQGASNLVISWNPAFQTPTVHSVEIVRNGQRINALESADFTVLRREQGFETALAITGALTGVMSVPDVRVGDVVEFRYSLESRIDALGNPMEMMVLKKPSIATDLSYLAVEWPAQTRMNIRGSSGYTAPPVQHADGFQRIEVRNTDVAQSGLPDNLAASAILNNALMLSSKQNWSEVSDVLRDHFVRAAALPDDPHLLAEIERIRSEHTTPEARALAALRLVQDDVRYLAIGIGEAGWVPASAADTWTARLGDCKGKTVLLLAILKALDIEAVPTLVATQLDGLDRYLPMMSPFDHVIVRAKIGNKTRWLDGTMIGTRDLLVPEALAGKWALPLVANARLEQVPVELRDNSPEGDTHLTIDLSNGVYGTAPITAYAVKRRDNASEFYGMFAQAPAADVTTYSEQYWKGLLSDLKFEGPIETSWSYDAEAYELTMRMSGQAKIDWSRNDTVIPLAHVSWKAVEVSNDPEYANARYAVGFPFDSRYTTTITLPSGNRSIEFSVDPYEVEAGGVRYQRTVQREGNTLNVTRTRLALQTEMSADEARASQALLDSFKDKNARMWVRRDYQPTAVDQAVLTNTDGSDPEAALQRGYTLLNRNENAAALAQFDLAIAGFTSPHANAHANRAMAHLSLGDLDKGRADIAEAQRIDPNDVIAFHAQAMLAEKEDDDLGQILALTAAIQQWPDNRYALNQRARVYNRMGQYPRALADIEKVTAAKPDDPENMMLLAGQLLVAGRGNEARAKSDTLAEILGAPQSSMFIALARATASQQQENNDHKAAIAALNEALRIEDQVPDLLYVRASAFVKMDDRASAEADLAVVERLGRNQPSLKADVCVQRVILGLDPQKGIRLCDEAIAARPESGNIITLKGVALVHQEKSAEALEYFERALSIDRTNPVALYGRGYARLMNHDHEGGEADMNAAKQINPDVAQRFPLLLEVH